ncbi:26S proteasome non-ATPase regulatory subunit 9-like protein [Halteromyces radiatus]|uniref:26S proteasome non-ATPase regulatory subunit 9-like protein n=1 Tax=Halteromyces radiatus TaxID=101107 RepID=UPI0022212B11|nr:26S proteasome non-ATPase regulatory subunit 9-like protein [Halteromyces radiatus]KAI8092732.1 26S proteasome non-ATPase regulatory subunit 9-like protein [Halteromyces radiatus]
MGIPTHMSPEEARYRQEAQELMQKQDQLLIRLRGLEEELQTQGIGMDEPLIDSQGYPRSDIDVAAARHTRNQVYHLRNDHKKVMAEIETVLHQLHQVSKPRTNDQENQQPSTATTNDSTNPATSLYPFAKVNAVSPDSPASEAGLRSNDLLVQFGNITNANFQQLSSLTSVVQASLNQPLEIKIMRGQDTLTLTLTPRNGWGGRGALGCHILPYTA